MKKYTLLLVSTALLIFNPLQSQTKMKVVNKQQMTVKWEYKGDRIFFEIEAPTDGWVAIGFNRSENITGTYLIMARVLNGETNVVEHYTIKPGNYKSFSELMSPVSIQNTEGSETKAGTKIRFSLPILAINKYAKDLTIGKEYVLLMAYSQEDDFKHHSVMRTSERITL
jgi:hypothetical protein